MNRVLRIEGMPASAYRPARCPRSDTIATSEILSRRHGFQMIRSHASAVPAQVIQLEVRRNRAPRFLVAEPMRLNRSTVEGEPTVTSCAQCAEPEPAPLGLLNFRPETSEHHRSPRAFEPWGCRQPLCNGSGVAVHRRLPAPGRVCEGQAGALVKGVLALPFQRRLAVDWPNRGLLAVPSLTADAPPTRCLPRGAAGLRASLRRQLEVRV